MNGELCKALNEILKHIIESFGSLPKLRVAAVKMHYQIFVQQLASFFNKFCYKCHFIFIISTKKWKSFEKSPMQVIKVYFKDIGEEGRTIKS